MSKLSFKRTKNGFDYTGDLEDVLEYAEICLLQYSQSLPYVTRRFLEEKKRIDTLKRNMKKCADFIKFARDEIEERIFDK